MSEVSALRSDGDAQLVILRTERADRIRAVVRDGLGHWQSKGSFFEFTQLEDVDRPGWIVRVLTIGNVGRPWFHRLDASS